MHYQYLPDRGPWNREKLWLPQHKGQAAYIVPCITNITDGPSGVTYYPGTGLGDQYEGHFFVCDFRGSAAGSCIFTWTLKPKGASFELTGARKFLEGMLATDCDFGPDGGLYVSDWIDGWTGLGKGRIYRVVNPTAAKDPRVQDVWRLLIGAIEKAATEELVRLLGHADRRVRLEAQFELVKRREYDSMLKVAEKSDNRLARLHGIWGVGQLLRLDHRYDKRLTEAETKQSNAAYARLVALIDDADDEIAGQAAVAIVEAGAYRDEETGLYAMPIKQLFNRSSLRAKFLAATASAKLGALDLQTLLAYFEDVGDEDAVLRHALLRALNVAPRIGNEKFHWFTNLKQPTPRSRLAGLLASRLERSAIDLLDDSDPHIVLESARSIHDLHGEHLMPQLAARIDKPFNGNADQSDALFRRVLNANFRLGRAGHAVALAKYAGKSDAPEHLRIEAIEMLGQWAKPSPRDRVLGSWRPLPERAAGRAADALRAELGAVFSGSARIREKAAEVAAKLGVKEVVPELVKLVDDEKLVASARVAALRGIALLDASRVDAIVERLIADREPALRIGARQILAERNPAAALENLKQTIADGTIAEKQAAYATVAGIANPQADELLVHSVGDLLAGRIAPEARLDLITAARQRVADEKRFGQTETFGALRARLQQYDDSLSKEGATAAYRDTLAGGDVARGRSVFYEKVALSCLRCHKIGEHGGEVGPDLTKIGADKTREYLMDAIVEPNKAIAKGFETVVVTTDDGLSKSGIVKNETDRELTLITAEGLTTIIPKASIEERTTGQSAMPADLVKQMSLTELRDLLEFLAQLR
jgi:quinoprotein glucose dehydrogenase